METNSHIEEYSLRDTGYISEVDILQRWSGDLWSRFSEEPEVFRRLIEARSLFAAQLEVWFNETRALSSRRDIPVMHRKRWYPLVLQVSERNTGRAAKITLGDKYVPRIGPQTEVPFTPGDTLKIGGNYNFHGLATYPLPEGGTTVEAFIVNNPVNPSRILTRGLDFHVHDSTIFFLHGSDPLDDADFSRSGTAEGSAVLAWAADTMFDHNYIPDFLAYPLGLNAESTEFDKRHLNALWDMYASGPSAQGLSAAVGAMLDEPYILELEETVDSIITRGDDTLVATDNHVYLIPADADLDTRVVPGAILPKGTLFTTTVRIFDNLDVSKLTAETPYGEELRTRISALYLPAGLFNIGMRHGICAGWQSVEVVSTGVNVNGDAIIEFDLGGSDSDGALFWSSFNSYCATTGIVPLEQLGAAFTVPTDSTGNLGYIIPAEFFLLNFLKDNTLIISVDTARLSERGVKSIHLLKRLRNVVPAHIRLVVISLDSLGPEEYTEYSDTVVAVDALAVSDIAGAGGRALTGLGYRDRVSARWIAYCT